MHGVIRQPLLASDDSVVYYFISLYYIILYYIILCGAQDMHGVIRQPVLAETLVKSTRLVEVRPEYYILNYYYHIIIL